MKTFLPEKIETIDDAKCYLLELISNGEVYHPEDDANDIEWNMPESEKPTDAELLVMNELMDQIFDLDDFDPCGFIIDSGGLD